MTRQKQGIFKKRNDQQRETVIDEFGLEYEAINLFEEPKWYKQYALHIILIVLTVLIIVTRTFFYAPYLISGESMMPTIEDFEVALVDKFTSHTEYDYGDIIIFSGENDYVKRIIAKGGDTISIQDNKVYVNKKPIKEGYLNLDYLITMSNLPEQVVPKDSFFVMGDNRNASIDSRNGLGYANEENIKGRVIAHAKVPLTFK